MAARAETAQQEAVMKAQQQVDQSEAFRRGLHHARPKLRRFVTNVRLQLNDVPGIFIFEYYILFIHW